MTANHGQALKRGRPVIGVKSNQKLSLVQPTGFDDSVVCGTLSQTMPGRRVIKKDDGELDPGGILPRTAPVAAAATCESPAWNPLVHSRVQFLRLVCTEVLPCFKTCSLE